uniref:50S ribosomal protein L9, chloroplastic n=1 Tax=Paulinella chromatophora TaxID=39717 RepID=B1X4E4_PAUCH|nr:50S ribosomal protein L9 [Paulinella chromatophora]ACB42813.1 50S ribosomal protein L9 [Paulinella chromatophora]|eukprot:gb/GEZN01021633.1/.p1 GENE.gb/GEZN01021633.1/~~gb/GEZN01021633.1/.p1  ORF type:complete len:153 (+),score=4.58 gb/GEZN01021633.1/:147-605(+)
MVKHIKVVLNESIFNLGKKGDLVEVLPGYARNFLIPAGKALAANSSILKQVEHRRAKEAERQAILKQEAINFRNALDTIDRFIVKKQTGGDDLLFGTVTNGDVSEAIEAATKRKIDRRDIIVPEINRTGSYKAQIKLHSDVVAVINLEVVSH